MYRGGRDPHPVSQIDTIVHDPLSTIDYVSATIHGQTRTPQRPSGLPLIDIGDGLQFKDPKMQEHYTMLQYQTSQLAKQMGN